MQDIDSSFISDNLNLVNIAHFTAAEGLNSACTWNVTLWYSHGIQGFWKDVGGADSRPQRIYKTSNKQALINNRMVQSVYTSLFLRSVWKFAQFGIHQILVCFWKWKFGSILVISSISVGNAWKHILVVSMFHVHSEEFWTSSNVYWEIYNTYCMHWFV